MIIFFFVFYFIYCICLTQMLSVLISHIFSWFIRFRSLKLTYKHV
jgi:hypothetical protein